MKNRIPFYPEPTHEMNSRGGQDNTMVYMYMYVCPAL